MPRVEGADIVMDSILMDVNGMLLTSKERFGCKVDVTRVKVKGV